MTAVTEAEAHAKWCPLVKEPNGSASPQKHTHCIASACMAWRTVIREISGITVQGRDEYGKPMKEDLPPVEARGYCGAFGAP